MGMVGFALRRLALYPFTDGSWVVENFANASKMVVLTAPAAGGAGNVTTMLQLKSRSWTHHWAH
jgi:hypothetical protein